LKERQWVAIRGRANQKYRKRQRNLEQGKTLEDDKNHKKMEWRSEKEVTYNKKGTKLEHYE